MLRHSSPSAIMRKPGQRLQRLGAAFGMQPASGNHVAADAANGFFILQHGGDAASDFRKSPGAPNWSRYPQSPTGRATSRPGPRAQRGTKRRIAKVRNATAKNQVRRLLESGTFILRARPRPDKDGIGHEIGMRGKSIGVLGMGIALVTPIPLHIPALCPVLEQRHHDLVQHLLMDRGIFDGNQRFPPAGPGCAASSRPLDMIDLGVLVRQAMAVAPKQMMRPCSRKRPTMDLTRIFSDRPGTPGRRQQIPRITSSICTPAWLAR